MNIRIDSDVLEYMKKKGKLELTLTILQSGGGCCPTIETPEIDFAQPKNIDKYTEYTQEGIHIYVDKNVHLIAPVLHFKLETGLFMKRVVPSGLQLKTHL